MVASPDRYRRTGAKLEPKPKDCQYQLPITVPAQPFQEQGIIDTYKSQTRDTAVFMEGVRPLVCDASGDVGIAEKSGNGFDLEATVIKLASAE